MFRSFSQIWFVYNDATNMPDSECQTASVSVCYAFSQDDKHELVGMRSKNNVLIVTFSLWSLVFYPAPSRVFHFFGSSGFLPLSES